MMEVSKAQARDSKVVSLVARGWCLQDVLSRFPKGKQKAFGFLSNALKLNKGLSQNIVSVAVNKQQKFPRRDYECAQCEWTCIKGSVGCGLKAVVGRWLTVRGFVKHVRIYNTR